MHTNASGVRVKRPVHSALRNRARQHFDEERFTRKSMKKTLHRHLGLHLQPGTADQRFPRHPARLQDLGYEGVELGGFNPHPGPDTCDRAKRQKLRKDVADHGLAFSGLAADLWSQKLWSVEDRGPSSPRFAKNVFFADDLGIDTIRVDTVEPITRVEGTRHRPES